MTTGALPSRLKLKLGLRYVPFLERHAELTMHDPAAAAALDGESIAEWGRRELGDDFVELLVYPLLASHYGVTPEETSAAFFHGLAFRYCFLLMPIRCQGFMLGEMDFMAHI